MPNHIHGILIINPDPYLNKNSNLDSNIDFHLDSDLKIDSDFDSDFDSNSEVQTRHALSLRNTDKNPEKSIGQNRHQNPGKNSISSIIGGYKSAVTKHANRLNLEFAWQTRFYDHIIRDERVFDTISNYIINNPLKWGEDKFQK